MNLLLRSHGKGVLGETDRVGCFRLHDVRRPVFLTSTFDMMLPLVRTGSTRLSEDGFHREAHGKPKVVAGQFHIQLLGVWCR